MHILYKLKTHMRIIYLLLILVSALLISSCSDDTVSSSETKDSYTVNTVNDTTTVTFEIVGLKISDKRTNMLNNAASRFSTRIKVESISEGSFIFNAYQDVTVCSTMKVNKVVDTTTYSNGKVSSISFIPDNFTGKGTIVLKGRD